MQNFCGVVQMFVRNQNNLQTENEWGLLLILKGLRHIIAFTKYVSKGIWVVSQEIY